MARGVIYQVCRLGGDAPDGWEPSPFDEWKLGADLQNRGEADWCDVCCGDGLSRDLESLAGMLKRADPGGAVETEPREGAGGPRMEIRVKDAAALKRGWFSAQMERLRELAGGMTAEQFADGMFAHELKQCVEATWSDMVCLEDRHGRDYMTLDAFVRGLKDGAYMASGSAVIH